MTMTDEERYLLLKDLSARVPYEVKINIDSDFLKEKGLDVQTLYNGYNLERIKPYLRPMSSMTEEEKEELKNIEEKYFGQALDKQIEEDLSSSHKDESRELEYLASSKIVDYLNKKMFDYRGLLSMGLALPAPADMYNF